MNNRNIRYISHASYQEVFCFWAFCNKKLLLLLETSLPLSLPPTPSLSLFLSLSLSLYLSVCLSVCLSVYLSIYLSISLSLCCGAPTRNPLRSFAITQTGHTTLGRTPLDEWSARRRDLYPTTYNTHKRQSCAGGIRTQNPSKLRDYLGKVNCT
jgi:hypothetical protein